MKFNEMTYTRPDIDALLARCRELAAKAAAAPDGDALVRLYYEQSEAFAEYNTAANLANIHYTCDTRDAYWKAEQDFFDANGPAVTNASVEISRAFLANPHVDALTEKFGTTCVAGMKNAVLSMDNRTVELQQQFNALVSRYQQIYGGALVELDGKQLTIPQLGPYKEDLDPAVRRAAYEAEAGYFDAHRDELDALYTKIVKNLNRQAQVLGYKDYSELSYLRMGRIDYGPEEVARYRRQVVRDVVPAIAQLQARRMKRVEVTDPKFYDLGLYFKDGNPTPHGTPEQLLAWAKQMYHALSPETARFIDDMFQRETFDVLSRPGKAQGGYCETIPGYGPFVFSNFNGTSGDVDVLTHEAGHAFADFIASQTVAVRALSCPTMEGAETHSMSMEFLTAPWHHLFFGELTDKYELSHAEDALLFIPYGCLVDHFQEEVYRHPEMTPEERNQKWLELEGRYRPYINFDGLPFYGRGAGWQRQLHIYLYPFYYIDYCMAQVMSLQFYALSLEDREKAWEKYMAFVRQGGTKTFVDLAHSVDLRSPIDQGCVKDVCQAAFQWTEGHLVE